MTDRPILFSAPMIQAIQREIADPGNGHGKIETRRLLKPQPIADVCSFFHVATVKASGRPVFNMRGPMGGPVYGMPVKDGFAGEYLPPYAVGDRLWVRERFRGAAGYEGIPPSSWGNKPIWYSADGEPNEYWWHLSARSRPGIHMPRFMSRFTLDVTAVRVQRLQEISDQEAIDEGVTIEESDQDNIWWIGGPRNKYRKLWDSLNAHRASAAWADNPFVVAVRFTPRAGNIDGEIA